MIFRHLNLWLRQYGTPIVENRYTMSIKYIDYETSGYGAIEAMAVGDFAYTSPKGESRILSEEQEESEGPRTRARATLSPRHRAINHPTSKLPTVSPPQ